MSVRDFRRHAGRLAVVGFAGQSAPDDLRRMIATFDLAGVIYFSRNVVTPAQVAELSREISALAREWPLWISVDQEGGRVARLKHPFTEWPPMAALGRSADIALVERFATALAVELRAVGITLDYAPVLDVHTNPDNRAIGDRALSASADVTGRLGAAVVRSLQRSGVAACGKHFPGHGDTVVDSHDGLPVVEHDRRRLEAVEFEPFRQAIAADVASIMVAHVLVPALDAQRIASCSPAVIQDTLKGGLRFAGVVFTDDLGMKAATGNAPLSEVAVAAIAGGCDAVLLCNSTVDEQVTTIEALIRAVESGVISSTRLEDALGRQRRMKEQWAARLPERAATLDLVGSEGHRAIAREMAAWA